MRGANLANIYNDAGMTDVSVREAVRAVNSDYANYSAHLFLANSYDRLRDPNQINLRFETPFFSEYLVANLLAPVGAGTLSQSISQQEYSKLFEQDRFGFSSVTEYLSRGDWAQGASQYGTFGNVSYALEAGYRRQQGQRPNNDLDQKVFSQQFKLQAGDRDTVYFQALESYSKAGNLIQYYDESLASLSPVRIRENQEPILIAGLHHEWSPGAHTLLLASRLDDTLQVQNPGQSSLVIAADPFGMIQAVSSSSVVDQQYRSRLEIYSTEIQQILELPRRNTLVAGARFQIGDFKTENDQTLISDPVVDAFALPYTASQALVSDFQRINAYAYDQWRLIEALEVLGGVSYDHLRFPENHRFAPISDREQVAERLSPKAGIIWTPRASTVMRGAYAQSLGGVSFDQSFQLEPTQVAGFNQAFRSIIPESVAGANSGARFETYGISLEQRCGRNTYIGLSGELLNSKVRRAVGTIEFDPFAMVPITVSGDTPESLDFQERTLVMTINQLISDEWSVGARYRLSEAELEDTYPEIPLGTVAFGTPFRAQRHFEATLHQLDLFAIYNHPSGFFSRFDALWYRQSNRGYELPEDTGALIAATPDQPGDDFWQFNLVAGYRLPRRRAELTVGLLNIFDQDYRLNPLNLYNELPRERTLAVTLRLNF